MLQKSFCSAQGLIVVKSLAEAVRNKASPLVVNLEASEDLQCRNLLCEKVGEPCICRLSHVLESLQDVRALSLAGNSLAYLPDSVWKLHGLTSLDLARNLLVSIPAEAARMRSLEVLNLEGNDSLEGVPEGFSQRTNIVLPQHLQGRRCLE